MKTWRGHINKTRKGEERLKCPFCNAADTKVIDSRPADDNSSIRRRRQCETCGKRFTTYEKLETIPLIEAGILHSCHKRPVSQGQISALIDDVENNLFNREEREISTAVIGELVMERLKDLDVVTYVRFASVYREFKDVDTFMEELQKIQQRNVPSYEPGKNGEETR